MVKKEEYIEMCEKSEKTIQLEGYEYKQCEHGYCYQHGPEWDYSAEIIPATKQGVWRGFKRAWLEGPSGLIKSLFIVTKRYYKAKHHCGGQTEAFEHYRIIKCKKCGRLVKEFSYIEYRCKCCGYKGQL
ncbi:MAG: hypothetical protein WCT49_04265 [Candidatus Paceibacterota bacterium]|jgi:hypothetical protein|nr:hypothetical protein [Candidatus Paceibacterota bacterium]